MYGRADTDWEDLIQAGLHILQGVATRKSSLSYSQLNVELADSTGQSAFNFTSPDGVAGISRLLADIGKRGLETHSGVLLTSIVTGKHSNEPGSGFYALAESTRLFTPGTDKVMFWVEQMNATHAFYNLKHAGAGEPLTGEI